MDPERLEEPVPCSVEDPHEEKSHERAEDAENGVRQQFAGQGEADPTGEEERPSLVQLRVDGVRRDRRDDAGEDR